MSSTIKFRRDIASDWLTVNPVLAPGEPGYELDSGRFKIGDGVARWADLNYFLPSENASLYQDLVNALDSHVNSPTPHPVYDDGPSLFLLYQNAKV